MPGPWRVELFGGLRVLQGSRVVDKFRTEKTASLLAYLALHKGRPQAREALCHLLWTDADPIRARQSLSTALWWLRRELEAGGEEALPLEACRQAVHLDGAVSTDVEEFEAAAQELDATPAAVSRWRRAVSLYREPFVGTYEEWLVPLQEGIRQHFLDMLLRLSAHQREAGDARGAAAYARQAVAADPLSEPAGLALMQALCADGDTGAAVREYRRLEAALRGELGARPGESARRLFHALTGAGTVDTMTQTARPGETDPPPPGPEAIAAGEVEAMGGAVPLHSRFYVARRCDRELEAAVERREMLILLKGAGQMWKSSLLARGVEWARASGARIALCDVQKLGQDQLSTASSLFQGLGQWMAAQLRVEVGELAGYIETLGPSIGFEWFMRQHVLESGPPLVWAIDEADRFFTTPHGVELFRLIRSWYNERALDPAGPWTRLTVVLAYSTEAHLLIPDPNQSPFNVGCHIELEDLGFAEVERLNTTYGSPLHGKGEVSRLMDLLGGHPFLVRMALDGLAARKTGLEWIEQQARQEGGLFRAHLAHLREAVRSTSGGEAAVQALAAGAGLPDEDVFFRLRSAGLVSGAAARTARFRCRLYARHFGGRSAN